MNRKTNLSLCAALVALAVLTNNLIAGTYVLDPPSPSWPDSNDILTDYGPFASLPRGAVPAAAMGLAAGDVIDALSDGQDGIGNIDLEEPPVPDDDPDNNDGPQHVPLPFDPAGENGMIFSVQPGNNGAAGTGVRFERTTDTPFPPGANTNGQAADLFTWTGSVGTNVLAAAPYGWRGDNGDESRARLRIPMGGNPADNVNAYDRRTFRAIGLPGAAGGGFDDNIPWAGAGVPVLARPIFFSLAAGSPTLGAIGANPGDILVVGAAWGATPAVFLTTAQLGIPAFADLDSLTLDVEREEDGTITATAARYTVTAGTAGFPLPGGMVNSGADVIRYDGAASFREFTHAQIGLQANDDIDAQESYVTQPNIFGIVPLGNAVVEPYNGGADVAQIGSSGLDGVQFQIHETTRWDGFVDVHTEIKPGASLEIALGHHLESPPVDGRAGAMDSERIGGLRIAGNGGGVHFIALNYTEVEWTYVRAFRGGEPVYTGTNVAGDSLLVNNSNLGRVGAEIRLIGTPQGPAMVVVLRLGGQEGEEFHAGDETFTADRLVLGILTQNENITVFSSLAVTGANLSSFGVFGASRRGVLVGGDEHEAIGTAKIERHGNGVAVSNIGSGEDSGVSIAKSEESGSAGEGGGAMTGRRSFRGRFEGLQIAAEDDWETPRAIIAVELDAGVRMVGDADLEAMFVGIDEDTTIARFETGAVQGTRMACFLSSQSLEEPTFATAIDEGQFVRFEGRLEIVEAEVTPESFRFRFANPVRVYDVIEGRLYPCDVVVVEHAASEVPGTVGISRIDIIGTDLGSFVLSREGDDQPEREVFRRGDADGNGVLELTDSIRLLGFLFLGAAEPGCLDAADSNDDGKTDIGDAVNSLNVLFLGSGNIPAPGAMNCGVDPTDDGLGCAAYDSCD